jgi:hypothetical protein
VVLNLKKIVKSSFVVNRPEKILWVHQEPLTTIVAHNSGKLLIFWKVYHREICLISVLNRSS